MMRDYGDIISDNRGIGLTLNMTFNSKNTRDGLADNLLKRHGIYVRKSGERGIALRPSMFAEVTFIEL